MFHLTSTSKPALKPVLARSNKVYPTTATASNLKSFDQIWREAVSYAKLHPFVPDRNFLDEQLDAQEKYAWVDSRLEDMSSHVEEEDDDKKNNITFQK
jgi:hypothetical protein